MGLNSEFPAPLRNTLVAKELVLGATATLLFFLSVAMIPVFGIFAGVFTPLPTLLVYYRWGSPWAFWVPGGAAVLGYVLLAYLNLPQSLPYLLEMLLLGLLLGFGMRRNWSLERTVGIASLMVFALGTMVFLLTSEAGSESVGLQMERDLRETLTTILQQYGAATPDKQSVEEAFQKMLPFLLQLLPGAALSSTLMACWLNLVVAKRYCRIHQLPMPAWQEWRLWKAPDFLVWIVIAVGIALLLPFVFLKIPGLNLLMVVGVIYLFQGLAIVGFYFERWKLPKIIRAVLYTVILIQQFFTLGAMLMGLFDIWIDFRRLSREAAASK
jgi:uncharacterized protein YybS (DUF2232 family)